MNLSSSWMRAILVGVVAGVALLGACSGDEGTAGKAGPPGEAGTTPPASKCTVTEGGSGCSVITCDDGTSTTVCAPDGGAPPQGCTVTDDGDGCKTIACDDGTSEQICGTPDGGTTGPWTAGIGLKFEVTQAAIASGKATVKFKLTDNDGKPLDRAGVLTQGAVSASFVIAALQTDSGGAPDHWVPYTTTQQTSPITNDTETHPGSENNGTFTPVAGAPGEYEYEFSAAITSPDTSKTHAIGVFASRDVGGKRYVANTVHRFVPAGGTALLRQLVTTEGCNNCHGRLSLHGDRRRDVELCTLCHSAPYKDPDTGNRIDFAVMIHKIHRGHNLPSVVAGTPYQIIGYNQSVHDYSSVLYPQAIQNCETCHKGTQADNWKTKPSRHACGACHDNIAFVEPPPTGMTLHTGGAQLTDANCSFCHGDVGGLAPIPKSHYTRDTDPAGKQIELEIVSISNTAPGQTPELIFSVKEKGVVRNILTTPLNTLRVTIAGPTTDYAERWQHTIQGSGSSGTLAASGTNFLYTFPAAMPASATGSYAVGLEGRNRVEVSTGVFVNYDAMNPVAFFPVTDTTVVPRREVITNESCENCHYKLSFHGGIRRSPEYCMMCHNANLPNATRVSRFEDQPSLAQPTHFKWMIHAIHMGEERPVPLSMGGFPTPNASNPAGNQLDFSEIRFPRPPNDCAACHKAGTWSLPITQNALASLQQLLTCSEPLGDDANNYCDNPYWTATNQYIPPATSACTSCHAAPSSKAHAATMTSGSGDEGCATCHKQGSSYDPDKYHALNP